MENSRWEEGGNTEGPPETLEMRTSSEFCSRGSGFWCLFNSKGHEQNIPTSGQSSAEEREHEREQKSPARKRRGLLLIKSAGPHPPDGKSRGGANSLAPTPLEIIK